MRATISALDDAADAAAARAPFAATSATSKATTAATWTAGTRRSNGDACHVDDNNSEEPTAMVLAHRLALLSTLSSAPAGSELFAAIAEEVIRRKNSPRYAPGPTAIA